MGWFDEQIEFRKKHERELLNDSFENIARAVTGRKRMSFFKDDADVSDAVSALLKHFGIKEKEVPRKIKGLQDRLDYLLSSTGILYREVVLKKGWHKDAMGAMITTMREDGTVVAVLPSELGGYEYTDPRSGKKIKVNVAAENILGEEALCFYRPLPMRALKVRDLFHYMYECLTMRDIMGFGVAALAVALVGMLLPRLNRVLIGPVVEHSSMQLLYAVMSFMLFV